jgi:hypothetical protein
MTARILRFLALGVLAAGVASCSMFNYSNIVSHKYALVYGVTRYMLSPDPAAVSPNLTYPAADAQAMAALLAQEGYTVSSRWTDVAGNIFVNGGNVGTISDSGILNLNAPSKATIEADLAALAPSLGPNDILVVYFSGHGSQDPTVIPSREYVVPYQHMVEFVDPSSGQLVYGLNGFTLSIDDTELKSSFDAMQTPRKVLILDTCNSGGFIGNQVEADWTPPAYVNGPSVVGPGTMIQAVANYAAMQSSLTGLSPYGAQVLSAAGRDELSYESPPPYAHGIMTYYLLQGLAGAADLNHDGHVTVLEAFSYAKAGVDTGWNPVQGSSFAFEPHVSGGPVDFELF